MCGICGILRIHPESGPVSIELLNRMTDVLEYRGPNDRGTWQDQDVSLGCRRLSVIDLTMAGHQPMANEDGSVWITYNGEIYNFRELKEQFALVSQGHVFRSRTDTEVLIHLYEEIGPRMFHELNGMFAFAIWNAPKRELILARDRYGIKPLFYYKDTRHFRFGSEIKVILADRNIPRKPSLQAMHDFLTFDYIPGTQTAFDGIYELPPGHWMRVDHHGNMEINCYWSPTFETDESITESTAVRSARELTQQAVVRQLMADVPVGVLLSGGLDSSAITAFMPRGAGDRLHTYSIGFEENSFNELFHARMIAKQFGTIAHEVIITPQLVRDLLKKYLTYIDEPYADGSAIPTYYVCQLAKNEVVVVLSGEGGDEAFGGYDTYAAYKVSRWFRRVPRAIRQRLISPIVNLLPVSDKKLSLEFRMKRFLGGQDLPPDQAHLWWRVVLTEAQKMALYSQPVQEQFVPAPSDRFFRDIYSRSSAKDELSRLFHIDAAVFLPDDLMVKNDRMSMAHSLEARVPFTDNDLTEFLSRVPPRLKLKGLRKKYLLRRAMEGMLPPEVLDKKKMGLEMPYSRWFKHELKDMLLDTLSQERLCATGLFRPDAVKALIDDHLAARCDHGRALWGLLNYMLWWEIYID